MSFFSIEVEHSEFDFECMCPEMECNCFELGELVVETEYSSLEIEYSLPDLDLFAFEMESFTLGIETVDYKPIKNFSSLDTKQFKKYQRSE